MFSGEDYYYYILKLCNPHPVYVAIASNDRLLGYVPQIHVVTRQHPLPQQKSLHMCVSSGWVRLDALV